MARRKPTHAEAKPEHGSMETYWRLSVDSRLLSEAKEEFVLHKWLIEATRTRGSAKALVYRDTYLSWRGLQHRVERRVQEFGAMGISKGHWVGLMLGNVPDFAILTLALSKVGATVVPLDPTTGARDLSLILEHAPLRALITRPRGGVETQQQPTPEEKNRESLESR